MKRTPAITAALIVVVLTATAFGLGRKDAAPKAQETAPDTVSVRQGVAGRVEIWEGDFMPMVDPAKVRGQITPGAGRRIRIYEPVRVGEGAPSARRDSIPARIIAETVCDSLGQFFIRLEPGAYSAFVEEGDGWYFNGFDGNGIQGAFAVKPDSISNLIIKITLKATH